MADFEEFKVDEFELTSDNEVIDTTTGEIIPVEKDGLTGPETALIGAACVAIGAVGYGIGKGIEALVKKTKNDWIPAFKESREEKKAAKAAKKAEKAKKKEEAKVAESIETPEPEEDQEEAAE